jgi:hypothetical protein
LFLYFNLIAGIRPSNDYLKIQPLQKETVSPVTRLPLSQISAVQADMAPETVHRFESK